MFKDKLTFWRHREAMLDVINNIAAQNRFGNTRVMIHQRYDKNRERTEENGI